MKNDNGIIYNIDNKQKIDKIINNEKNSSKKNEKNNEINNNENNIEKLINQHNSRDNLNKLKLASFDTSKHINFCQNKKINLKENSNNCQKNNCKKNDIEAHEYNGHFINKEKNIPDNHQKNRENIYKKMSEKMEVTNFFKEKSIEQNKNSEVHTNFNNINNIFNTLFEENLNFKNHLTESLSFSNIPTNKLNPCENFLKNPSNNENFIVHNKNDETKNKMNTLNYNNYKNQFEDENEVEARDLRIKNMNTFDTNQENYYERNDDNIYLKKNDIEKNCVNNDNFNNYTLLNNESKIYNNNKNYVMYNSDNMENENILNETEEIPIINKKVINSNNYIIEKKEEKNNENYSNEKFIIDNFNTQKNYFLNNKKDYNDSNNNNNKYIENNKNNYNNYIFYKNNVCNNKIENNFIDKYKINNKNANYNESNNIKITYNNCMNPNEINNLNKDNLIISKMDHLNTDNNDNDRKTYFLKNEIVDKTGYNTQENNSDGFIKNSLIDNINTLDNFKLMNYNNNSEYNDINNNHLIKYSNNVNNYNDGHIYSMYDTFMSPNYNFNNDDNNVNNLFINNDSINSFSYAPNNNGCYMGDNYENNIYINSNSPMKNEQYINYNKNYASNNNINNNNIYANEKSINNLEYNNNGYVTVNSASNLNYVNDKNQENLKGNISHKKDNEYMEYKFPGFIKDNASYDKKYYNTFSKNDLICENKEFVDNNYSNSIKNNKEQNMNFNNKNYNNFNSNNNYIENNKIKLKKTENDSYNLNDEKEKIDIFCDMLFNKEKRAINNREMNYSKNREAELSNEDVNNSFKNFTNDNQTLRHISYNEKNNSEYAELIHPKINDNYCLNKLRSNFLENNFNNFDSQYINYKKQSNASVNEINNNTQPSLKKKAHFTNEFPKNKQNEENELYGNKGFLYEGIQNFNNSESLYTIKNKDINNSFELSLFDNNNELNNKYEGLFEKKMIYNLYLQSLLTNINNSYKNENSSPISDENIKNGVNDQLILFNLNNMQNKILNKFPKIKNYFSYLDYYIESLRLLYNKLLSNRNLILKLAKEIFSKNINEKKIYSSIDERHSYFRELLSMLLPQPPIFPSFEIWIYMDKKNASQIHKLHLTLYIIYQKIIYNFSNILLQINSDINYSNKNKTSKNNVADSLNYYVDDKHEKHPNEFKSSLNSEYISKDIVEIEEDITHKNSPINELKSNDSKILVPSATNKIMKYSDADLNFKNKKIEKKYLLEINKKLENIMNSINNISNMINKKKESILDNKRDLNSVREIISDKKRRSVETIDDNIELSNNNLYERENDHDHFLPELRKESCLENVRNINEKKKNYTFNNQIVAYDDLKNDELFENLSNIKLDKNNSVYDENTLNLLDKIKYELSDVYNEIFNLNKYNDFVSINDQSNDFSGLRNSMSYSTISNTKSKLKNSYLNGLLDNEDFNYNELNNPFNNYFNFSNNQSLNKKDFNNRNKLINNIENINLCSNESINDIIYDLNCTDDIFKRLIILSKNYYNNLSEYDNYLINAYKENEKKYKGFNEIKNSNNIDDELFYNKLLPSNEKNNISVNNNNINISNKDNYKNINISMNNSLICDTNGDVSIYSKEKENDTLNKLNKNSFIFTNNDENNSINNNDLKKKEDFINMNLHSFKNSFENLTLDNQNDFNEKNNSLILSEKDESDIIINKKKQLFLSDDVSKNKRIEAVNEGFSGYSKNNEIINYSNDNNMNNNHNDNNGNDNDINNKRNNNNNKDDNDIDKKNSNDKDNNNSIKYNNSNDFNNNIRLIGKKFNEDNKNSNNLIDNNTNNNNYNSNNDNDDKVNNFLENVKNEMLKSEVKYATDNFSNNEKLNYDYFFLNSNNSDNLLMEKENNSSEAQVHELSNFFSKNMNFYDNRNSMTNNIPISENIFEPPKINHDTSETKLKEENKYYEKLKIKKNNSYISNPNEKIDEQLSYLQSNFVLNKREATKNPLSIIKGQENCYHNQDNISSNFLNAENLLNSDSLKYDINSHDKYDIIINNNLENNSINRKYLNNHLNNGILRNDNIRDNLLMDNNSNLIVDANINNSDNNLLNQNILSNGIVNNNTINEKIINLDIANYNKIDDNIINNHLINDNINYYNTSSHLLNYRNLKNDLENNIFSSQIIDNKLIDNKVPDNNLISNEFRDNDNLNILCDDNLNPCINFHKGDIEDFKNSSLESRTLVNVDNNYYKGKVETNDMKDFSENGMKNKRKYNFSNDQNLIEDDAISKSITKSPQNSKYTTENLSSTEIWKYDNDHPKQSNEINYDENTKKSLNNVAEIKDIENKDKINNVNKTKLKKMLEITDKLIGKKYRGISYDPTRNGWSTFVYKGGVRHKKFFSSFKYGNLLAKKKSIEWRLKNLNPNSHAYAFSLQAKEEFNAILNNDYEEMNTSSDKKNQDNSDNMNRDILYINAFLNLFNDEKEKKYSSDESDKMKKSRNNEVKNNSKKKIKKNNIESNCDSSNKKNLNTSVNYDTNISCSNEYTADLNDKNTKDIDQNEFINKKKNNQNKNKKNKKTEGGNNSEYKKNKKERYMNLKKKKFINKLHLKNNFKNFSDINKLESDGILFEKINENNDIGKENDSCNLKKNDRDNDSFLNEKNFSVFLNEKNLNSKIPYNTENNIKKIANKESYKKVNMKINKKKKKKEKNNKINGSYNDSLSNKYFDKTKFYEKGDEQINSDNENKFNSMCLSNSSDDISINNSEAIMNEKNNSFIKYMNKKKRKRNLRDKNESISEIDILDKNDSADENNLMKENELFDKIYSLCENDYIDYDNILEKIEEFSDDDSTNKNYISYNSEDINEDNIFDDKYLMENFHLVDKNKLGNKMEVQDDNKLKNKSNMVNEDNYLMNDNGTLTEVDTADEEEIINKFYSLGKNDSIKENSWTKEMNIMNSMNSIEDNEIINEEKESNENKIKDIKKNEINENTQKKMNIPNEKEIDDTNENNNENKIDSYFSVYHDRNSNILSQNSFKHIDELSEEKRKLYVGNKNVNDQNYYIYKDKLLKYMSECTCTNEEEKNVFMKFLNLKTGWILLELSDLEETYHDYFRSKIESFYKAYLLKVKINNRQNENIKELQIIFEKKLNTPWKHMIFPLYFLYIFNYKIFSILKRTNKKVSITNDVNDKQLKSNIRGINYIKYKKAWCFTYIDIDEKKKKKCFSILEYGFMESKALAILFRKSFVSHLTKVQNFLKNVIFRNKLTTINKLSNYKTIYDYIDYYKKYEEFLVCYGKIIYFNEMKYIYLSSGNKQNALNYLPFEVHDKLSNEIEPINLITATRNYFSKKSKLLKFPKGVVYLSGYFLWVALFLNKNNKEIIFSFSVRKYSFENAKARCIECYYCLLHKYKFHPINISGVIDLVLESDIECKSYNLLDYSSEELISLEYLFHYFSPSNYIIKDDTVYKKFSSIEKDLHKEYDQMFPNEYVHLDNYQSYETRDNYLCNEIYMNNECNFFSNSCNNTSIRDDSIYVDDDSKMEQNTFKENIDSKIYLDKNYTPNINKEGNDQNIYEEKLSNKNSCNSSFESIFNINNDSINHNASTHKYEIIDENEIKNETEKNIDNYILRNYSNTSNDLRTIHNKKCDKKNIPLYFTDDEKKKTIYRSNSHNEENNYDFVSTMQNEKTKKEENKFSSTRNFINKENLSKIKTRENCNDANNKDKSVIHFNENSNEEKKNSLINQNNEKFNDCINDYMFQKHFNMLVENINDNNTNKNNKNTFNDTNIYINHADKINNNYRYSSEEKNISFKKKKYNELEKENNQEYGNTFHLNDHKANDFNNSIDEDNLEKKNDSEHFFNENNFQQEYKSNDKSFLNSDYYKKILNKSIYHFFDNNLQDDYLKKKYNELFNESEVKINLFKKIDKKEEHLGIFMLLNCQWLSDSFVNNIHQIETKYANIYSFENYRNTREEILKWKCKKNFIKECSEIAKKFPRKVGVHYDSYAHAWVVNCSFNGKRHDKKFLVKTFGFLQARKLAIEHREKWMQLKKFHSMQNLKKKINKK
ncbi:transcription factor with AP2 domain(s), putative [Plasmodium relictum]|uniref:Transcription factor with AP2 domain(S), putative n=1 Tax=Plasmodium relictum TaxID=85471 RepID=A0A1J1HAL8_PLARL|nr:transcription factor with AP2 domain(s), putative [Plasmodium relictum]CRH01663.1 transcription factor with AP2 domain(s), putative [Plasmodium relictum]